MAASTKASARAGGTSLESFEKDHARTVRTVGVPEGLHQEETTDRENWTQRCEKIDVRYEAENIWWQATRENVDDERAMLR